MNDLLNDIKKLENLKNLLWEKDISSKEFSRNKISTHIQEMIKEKLDIVSNFEKENMSYGDYEEHMKGVGFDPQFLIDQEVARQDELRIDNNVA